MNRRELLVSGSSLLAWLATSGLASAANAEVVAGKMEEDIRLPPLLDGRTGPIRLEAKAGATVFAGGAPSSTMGFNQSYLGPTVLLRRGTIPPVRVENGVDVPITLHWHGLTVPSSADGGPGTEIAPGAGRDVELPIRQPAATHWYHTHVHGRTAPDVYAGLAGAVILQDDDEAGIELPRTYGVDDFVLILQDKRFDGSGRAVYEPGIMDIMHGFRGDAVLVNGQLRPIAKAPRGLVRLRLINAATSSPFDLSLESGRPLVLIGVDQGLLDAPIEVDRVLLAPGERIELLVDLGQGEERLMAASQSSSMGMMGGNAGSAVLLTLAPDDGREAAVTSIPQRLPTSSAVAIAATGTRRRFVLDEGMGPMNMVRGLVGGSPVMTINSKRYEIDRIDFSTPVGAKEHWTIAANQMAHPFHVHGAKFQVLKNGGREPRPEERGWKDTVLVNGEAELAVSIDAETSEGLPFVFHCHILEHEDAGMMGQFTTQV
ncbi:multicopper oxidase family protein [Aurantimonas marina]|uniref:multicopper oxidase family protein n=1 Tax=Aurantimonas marina TaxID=2780508 RepID=UPI0019D0B310|nr:multicopper oxidase domain-containing protein [Aurantimonas marina]